MNMLEFLFGWLLGVWTAQQFKLPSVQTTIKTWWNSKPEITAEPQSPTEEDHEATPVFTGDMPPSDS